MKVSISGVRGIYGTDLNLHEVINYTLKFASMIQSGRCIVARDTRPSGHILIHLVTAALNSKGIDVYDIEIAPTPMAFRAARNYGAAIIITASHNPLEWNGLKFILNGRGIFEDELEAMLSNTSEMANKFGDIYPHSSGYINEVVNIINSNKISKLKVGLDPGGGATCSYADALFSQLGHEYYSVNDTRGISSRGPDPTSDTLLDLSNLVTGNGLDYGFAFDLDGDRLVVVNRNGEKLNPDSTLLLCIASSMAIGLKKIVTSLDTSIAISKFVTQNGGSVSYSKVGEANVVKKMLDINADAGGEGSSAGFILPSFNMCRDGFLASAMIAALDSKILGDALDFASQYTQIRTKFPADSSLHKQIVDSLYDVLSADSTELLTIDGIKAIVDEDSWILVRPSNTEHAIRVSVESTKNKAQKLYDKTLEKVQTLNDKIR